MCAILLQMDTRSRKCDLRSESPMGTCQCLPAQRQLRQAISIASLMRMTLCVVFNKR